MKNKSRDAFRLLSHFLVAGKSPSSFEEGEEPEIR